MDMQFRLVFIIWLCFALVACSGDVVVNDVAVSNATATREPTKVSTRAVTPIPATPLPVPTTTAILDQTEGPDAASLEGTPESVSEQADDADNGQQSTDTIDTSAAPGKAVGAAAITITGEAGMACFGTSGEGMSCISAEGEWQTYTEDNSQLPSDYITEMVSCSDASILIAHVSAMSLFDGKSFRRFDAGWGNSSPDDLVCDALGGVWIAHFEGVSYFDGDSWTTWDTDTYFAGDSLVNTVEIAPDGRVWIAASNTIAFYDGATWTTYEESDFGSLTFFDTLTIDSSGVVWATTGDGLLYLEDGVWISIESPNYLSVKTLTIDAKESKWIGTFNDGIELFENGSWLQINRESGELGSNRINNMVYDGSERLWIGTDYGVTVLADESGTTYRMDNAPLISNEINSLAVIGGGPSLPELMTFLPGGMSGNIAVENGSVANRTIEICVESIFNSFGGVISPCEGQPFILTTITDENGAFTFADVPVGRYVVMVETDSGWSQLTNELGFSSEMKTVAAGENTDVGEVVISDNE